MKGTRLAFIGVVGTALLTLGGAAFLKYGPQVNISVGPNANPAPTVTVAAAGKLQDAAAPQANATVAAETKLTEAAPAVAPTGATTEHLKPIWGPGYKENDGLGKITCGAYAFSADYVLQQIQIAGLDVKHGFHLGIVPFYLNENYIVTAKERTDALQNGTIDCLLTTFDLIALEDPGVLTAFINESAGGDQLWSRGLKSLNELKGKRIAFEADGPSEYFVQDLLATVQLTPKDVTLLPQPNQGAAIDAFNTEQADVVAGWTPVIFNAEKSGGQLLASSKEFRSILGGIVMSRQAMQTKRTVIQLFHDAWFEALAEQETNFSGAAKQIAQWGHNDFLGVQPETAEDDLKTLLDGVAQANLADNVRAFSNVSAIISRLLQARNLWAAAGHPVPGGDVTAIVNPEFVQASARSIQVDLNAGNKFVNNSFSLGRVLQPLQATTNTTNATNSTNSTNTTSTNTTAAISATVAVALPTQPAALANTVAVATLPCSRFEFVPNSTQLQSASQQELSNCALRVLQQNVNLYVRVKGSSAWPGPKGTYRQGQVESTAKQRADSVVAFLVAKGIARERFVVEWTLPPQDHWETADLAKQAQDRYVEITLLASGL